MQQNISRHDEDYQYGAERLDASYLIPFNELKMSKTPLAAGGGGQVYKGSFAGQIVAVMSPNL